MKIVVNYLNFVFHIEVKIKSIHKFFNFVFQFIKNMKWHFSCIDSIALHLRFIILLQLISKLHLVYSQSSVRHNDSKVSFFSFLIWMHTFQIDNRTFKIRIMTVDQCSRDCCSEVLISPLSKYLSDKALSLYQSRLFFRIVATISS